MVGAPGWWWELLAGGGSSWPVVGAPGRWWEFLVDASVHGRFHSMDVYCFLGLSPACIT